jgi:hypothetical protein
MIARLACGTLAALTAFAPLNVARGDELQQLRANQQQLQQQLDNISSATSEPAPPPGMPAQLGSFPRSFLVPGTSTSLTISGDTQLNVFERLH